MHKQRHIHKEYHEKTKKTSIYRLKREEKLSPAIPYCRTSTLQTMKKYTYVLKPPSLWYFAMAN